MVKQAFSFWLIGLVGFLVDAAILYFFRLFFDIDLFIDILRTYVAINNRLEAKDYSQRTLTLSDRFLGLLHDIGIIEQSMERPIYGYALASYYKASFLKKNQRFEESKALFNQLLR